MSLFDDDESEGLDDEKKKSKLSKSKDDDFDSGFDIVLGNTDPSIAKNVQTIHKVYGKSPNTFGWFIFIGGMALIM